MKRGALDNYFKSVPKKFVTNVEPKSDHKDIEENLTADDSSSGSALVFQAAKDVSTTYLDIGIVSAKLFQKKIINNDLFKSNIMKSVFVPTRSYIFPTRVFNKKNLKFQYQWLEKWEWLVYS